MRIIKMIFGIPFTIYLFFIMLKLIIVYIKSGQMMDEHGKFFLPTDWFNKVCYPVFDSKMHLRQHICWIFWITIALFITSLNT